MTIWIQYAGDPHWPPAHGGRRAERTDFSDVEFCVRQRRARPPRGFRRGAGQYLFALYQSHGAHLRATPRVLEGGQRCVATASGMAAILSTCMGLLKSGDHIVSSRAIFGTRDFVQHLSGQVWSHDQLRAVDRSGGVENAITPKNALAVFGNTVEPADRGGRHPRAG